MPKYFLLIVFLLVQGRKHGQSILGRRHIRHAQQMGSSLYRQQGRSNTGRLPLSYRASAGQRAQHGLARKSGENGQSPRGYAPQRTQQGEIVLQSLPEPEPRIDKQAILVHTSRNASLDPPAEKARHL